MISLAIKFQSKEEMEEWIEDKQRYRALPDSATIRLEDALDTFKERYVLTGKLEEEQRRKHEHRVVR